MPGGSAPRNRTVSGNPQPLAASLRGEYRRTDRRATSWHGAAKEGELAKHATEATPHRVGQRGARFQHLDMLRGLAALLVLMGHARGFTLVGLSLIEGNKLLLAPFYFVTGLAHQAVMVFFALSGFLVGGPALRHIREGRWDAADYGIHRLSRLWTTLIPALIATLLLDHFGRDLLGLPGYRGELHDEIALFGAENSSLAADTVLGNALFLQTILVPALGTNGPLWSLANEFWYYVLIPLGFVALLGEPGPLGRAAAGAVALGGALLLPTDMVILGSLWIAGAIAYLLVEPTAAMPRRARILLTVAALAAIVGTLAVSFARPGMATDLVLGLCCSAALPLLAALPPIGGMYRRLSFGLSEISFTLYVVHYPLLALLYMGLLAPDRALPGPVGFAIWAGLIAAALCYATLMWWLFERNTGRVRQWARRKLFAGRTASAPPRD